MFDRNKADATEYVSRVEAQEFVAETGRELSALRERVAGLEDMARTAVANTAASNPGQPLTLEDASAALTGLRAEGARQFNLLADKIDRAHAVLAQHISAQAPVPAVGRTNSVDYGAVAFGLSQIKDDVMRLSGNMTVSGADLARHYALTVQYFADVFSKSDTTFNEAEFKRQAGV